MTVDSELRVVFTGKDNGLSDMSSRLGKGFAGVGTSVMKGMAIGVTAIAGMAAATVGLGAKLLSLGSSAQETGSLINVSLGESAAGFNTALRDFAEDANRSFYDLQQGASTIVAMTKSMGAGEEGAADFGVAFAGMASDLGSFFNRTDSEVFLDLQSALAGSAETLQKYGVDIRETTLKQMAMNQGLITNTVDILPPLMRAQLIQQAITEQAADAMGDAVRTSDSWANSMRGLTGGIKDAATEAGLKLIPVMTPLLNLTADLAQNGIAFLSEKFEKLLPFLTEGATFVGNIVAGIQSGMTPLEAFNFAWGTLGRHLGLNSEMIKAVREKLGEIVGNIITVKDAVVGFITPIADWIAQNVELKDVLTGLAIVLGGAVLMAIGSIVIAMAPVVLTIAGVIAAVALLRTAWEADFLGIRTVITDWATEHGGIMQGIKDWWDGLGITLGQLKVIVTVALDELNTKWLGFEADIGDVVFRIKEIWAGLQTKFEQVKTGITNALQPIIDLIDGIKEALGRITLPDWMTPGSPTPWELGLHGVRNELQALYRSDLPALNTGLQGLQSVTNNRNNSITQTTNIYTSRVDTRGESAATTRFLLGGI